VRELQDSARGADQSAAAYRQELVLLQVTHCICTTVFKAPQDANRAPSSLVVQAQLEEMQQRCRSLESAVTHGESEKRDLLEHLSKLVQAVDERDAKLKEQVLPVTTAVLRVPRQALVQRA
jgi:hypothetical protein